MVKILNYDDSSTMLLPKSTAPTMHNIDLLIAGILTKRKTFWKEDSFLEGICQRLSNDLLKKKEKDIPLPLYKIVCQTASFLNPKYKSMCHAKILSDLDSAYNYDLSD